MKPATAFRPFLALLICTVVSCGGGGSAPSTEPGSSADIAVAMTRSLIGFATAPGGQVFSSVDVSLSPEPAATVLPVVTADPTIAASTSITVTRNGNGTFHVGFTFSNLAIGSYKGVFTLHLCKDAACSSEFSLSGNTLPYDITIVPPVGVTLSVNSIPMPIPVIASTSTIVHRGDRIALTADRSVTWEPNIDTSTLLSDVLSTSTTWSATVSSGSGLFVLNVKSTENASNFRQVSFIVN